MFLPNSEMHGVAWRDVRGAPRRRQAVRLATACGTPRHCCGSLATCGGPVVRGGRRRTIGCVHACACMQKHAHPPGRSWHARRAFKPTNHTIAKRITATQHHSPLSLLPRDRSPFLPRLAALPSWPLPSSPSLPPSSASSSSSSSSLPLPAPQSFLPCRSAATSASPPPSSRRRYRSRIASSSSSAPPPSLSSPDPSLSVAR